MSGDGTVTVTLSIPQAVHLIHAAGRGRDEWEVEHDDGHFVDAQRLATVDRAIEKLAAELGKRLVRQARRSQILRAAKQPKETA